MQLLRLQDVPCWFVRALFLLALALALVLLLLPLHARAEPIYRAAKDGVVVTVFSEPCAVVEVTNLPRRAVWLEGGASYEGCAGATPFGMLLFYFSGDRTVTVIPAEAFVRVSAS